MEELKINPIAIKNEKIHKIEIRLKGEKKWRKPSFETVKKGQGRQRYYRTFIFSKKSFSMVRIDSDYIVTFKKVNRKLLDLVFEQVTKEKISEVWVWLNSIRRWAENQDLYVGGFPLPDIKSRLLVSYTKGIKNKFLRQVLAFDGEREEFLNEWFQKQFLKDNGIGQVWGSRWKDPRSIKVWAAFYTQTPWREYLDDIPRFYIKTRFLRLVDLKRELGGKLGKDWTTTKQREKITEFVLKRGTQQSKRKGKGLAQDDITSTRFSEESGLLIWNFPMGVVAWKYVK